MGFFHLTFTDRYARRDNWLTRIDVRVKLIYILSMLAINIWAKKCFCVSLFSFHIVRFSAYTENFSSGNNKKDGIAIIICGYDASGQGIA